MKRTTIWVTLGIVLTLMAFIIVRANARGSNGWCGRGWHGMGPASYLFHELKLNDSQKNQIRSLLETERPIFSAHVHELLAENKQLNALSIQQTADPNKVQQISDRQATTIAALLMEKAQLQSKIYNTVLTPEQRTKADELQAKWESRLDHAAERIQSQPAQR
jgi:Spy/CpxP family protein refolding chaperone